MSRADVRSRKRLGGFATLLKNSYHSKTDPKADASNHRASGNVKGRSAIAMVFIPVK